MRNVYFGIKIHRSWSLFLYTSSFFPNDKQNKQAWKKFFYMRKKIAYDCLNPTMEYTRREQAARWLKSRSILGGQR